MSERHMTDGEMAEAQKLAEFTDNLWRGVEPITPRSKEELLIARALLSTSSAVRGMREALEMFEAWWEGPFPRALIAAGVTGTVIGPQTQAMLDAVRAALSLVEGEDKQARSPSALSAPTTTDTKDTTK